MFTVYFKMAYFVPGRLRKFAVTDLYGFVGISFWTIGCFASTWQYRNTIYYTKYPSLFNDISYVTRYRQMDASTRVECASACFSVPSCLHFIFCSERQACYLEDARGTVSCDLDCKRCLYFGPGEFVNMALGAATKCSSVYSNAYSCDKAVDGFVECNWATRSEGIGNWIKIDFGRPGVLTHARFVQRWRDFERNKDIKLEFSDGSIQQFQMPFHNSSDWIWDAIQLTPVESTWVRIETTAVYTSFNNGWQEIELLAWVHKGDDGIPLS